MADPRTERYASLLLDTQILGLTVAQLGVKLLVAWIEQRDGAYSVRGQRLICTLQ